MASRFGRNKKRKLLEKIALLEKRTLGAAGPATNEIDIETLIAVEDSSDLRESSRRELDRREVTLVGNITHHDQLMKVASNYEPVAYQGGRFIINSLSHPSLQEREYIGAYAPVTLALRSVL